MSCTKLSYLASVNTAMKSWVRQQNILGKSVTKEDFYKENSICPECKNAGNCSVCNRTPMVFAEKTEKQLREDRRKKRFAKRKFIRPSGSGDPVW